jgi:Ca2+-dependent lipid-binding protein
MPGTFVFHPIKAKLEDDKEGLVKMDPYCKFKIGWHHGKTSVASHAGKKPKWSDSVALDRSHDEHFAKLKVKDRDRSSMDDILGETKIDLDDIAKKGKVQEWFKLYRKDKLMGQILLDIKYDSH